ncbi:hypothetical protein [Trinickia fusca]|nr:hypothetical protein [Trinickia fusca]
MFHPAWLPGKALARRVETIWQRSAKKSPEVVHQAATNADEAAPRQFENEAERLERIAAYARCGYFNMGYTVEMFQLMGELPLDLNRGSAR